MYGYPDRCQPCGGASQRREVREVLRLMADLEDAPLARVLAYVNDLWMAQVPLPTAQDVPAEPTSTWQTLERLRQLMLEGLESGEVSSALAFEVLSLVPALREIDPCCAEGVQRRMLEVLIEGRSKVTGQAIHRLKMVRRLQQRCLREEADDAGADAQLPRPCGRSCGSCPVVHHAEEMAASAGRVVGRALSTEEVYQLCAALAGPLLQGHYAAEAAVHGESA